MKRRINGYLDIEEYFKRTTGLEEISLQILKDKNLAEEAKIGTSARFWFNYKGQKVLFKDTNYEYNAYSELLSEELAKYLGLSSASYDLAILKNRKGVITNDFKKDNYDYFPLFNILKSYLETLKVDIENEKYYPLYNNLEDIWCALSYFLREQYMTDEQVDFFTEELMLQFTNYFIFQIISGNYDMHSSNITVAISLDNTDAHLAPLYDNEDMFKICSNIFYERPNTPQLGVSRKSIKKKVNTYQMLEEYLRISDEYFIEMFKVVLRKLDETTIDILISKAESKIGVPIPYNIKYELRDKFNENLRKINEVLDSVLVRRR